jgi:hypothetical protein
MAVTRNTPWRHIGRVPYAVWRKRILDAGGLPEYAERDVWEAAGDDSALMLEMLEAESSYASNFEAIPADWWNAWNLQVAGRGMRFNSAVEAAAAWRARLYDDAYKGGVYKRTRTISELIHTYAPESDGNDTEGYIKGLVAGINRNGIEASTTPEEPPMASVESLKPDTIDAPVRKDRDGQGFNYGTRGPIVGLVVHETQGIMSGRDRQAFFSCPNGERCSNALVDYGIDQAGQLFEFQDPFTSNRIPHASGGTVQQFGNPVGRYINSNYSNVNKYFAAVEMEKTDNGHLTAAQIDTVGRLGAYVLAKGGRKKREFWSLPNHADVYNTSCRQYDDDRARFEAICDQALAGFWSGTTPTPPPTEPDIIPGVDWGIAKRAFDNPALPNYVLTKGGKLSELYIARVKETGQLPQLTNRWEYEDGDRVYYRFSNGDTAVFNDRDKSIRWIEGVA